MDWKQISTSQSIFYCPGVFTNAAGFKQTGRDTFVQRSSGARQRPSDSPAGQDTKSHIFFISRYLFHCSAAFRETLNQRKAFLLCVWTQCPASVFVRNSIIKWDMNGKKTGWKKRACTVSTDVFQLCDLSFVLSLFYFFCLSASLSV